MSPVDFPRKVQIAQIPQGWFENVDYLILTGLCSQNTRFIFSAIKTLQNMRCWGATWGIEKEENGAFNLVSSYRAAGAVIGDRS